MVEFLENHHHTCPKGVSGSGAHFPSCEWAELGEGVVIFFKPHIR